MCGSGPDLLLLLLRTPTKSTMRWRTEQLSIAKAHCAQHSCKMLALLAQCASGPFAHRHVDATPQISQPRHSRLTALAFSCSRALTELSRWLDGSRAEILVLVVEVLVDCVATAGQR
jgi:hypothetical protein